MKINPAIKPDYDPYSFDGILSKSPKPKLPPLKPSQGNFSEPDNIADIKKVAKQAENWLFGNKKTPIKKSIKNTSIAKKHI